MLASNATHASDAVKLFDLLLSHRYLSSTLQPQGALLHGGFAAAGWPYAPTRMRRWSSLLRRATLGRRFSQRSFFGLWVLKMSR